MVYNSHLKIMKKLLFSLVALVAMSLTFVACDNGTDPGTKPGDNQTEIESNCTITLIQTTSTAYGQVYLIETTTNDVALTNNGFSGTGDYFYMQMYAKPQEDLFPAANTYKAYAVEEMDEEFDVEEFVMGGTIYEGYPAGTFIATIQNGENTDIWFCIGGTVEFKGNSTNGTMIAKLEFQSLMTEDIEEKEFIFNGAVDIETIQSIAPQKIKILE